MTRDEKNILQKVAHTIRALSADAIEKQQSGHPGLPLGAAELGAFLFTKVLRHNPSNPKWPGRDRFVLSAGHGSMFQYALLHLCGYDLSLDDIRNFRQLGSLTPGHPEYGETPGVETTTGPLGQGIAAATGMAISQKLLADRFGEELFDHKIWVLAGDGCIMEGISSEAGSLAGNLGLNNLVIIYDSNDVCLDGPTSECLTEDTARRYESYGFQVMSIDGYDFDEMEVTFSKAREESAIPTLIIAKTIIGKCAPNRQGKSVSHGKFLGQEEMRLFKQEIGWPLEPLFYIPDEVKQYFKGLQGIFSEYEEAWQVKFEKMRSEDPAKATAWKIFEDRQYRPDFKEKLWKLPIEPNQPTRKYNEALIAAIARELPFVVTGSADVASVDFTWLPGNKIVSRDHWNEQQIKFGAREFCMAGCAYGMQLYGMIQPVVGTFLIFSDYMRNAMRLAALMKQRVIFVFSHDSILIGQDGPTHQPVEQLMSLRLVPNLVLLRPGDENESKAAWTTAFTVRNQPVALCFTRQPVKSTVSELTSQHARHGVPKGAYVLYGKLKIPVDIEIFSSGSEIHPSMGAAKRLEEEGIKVRVVSIPSWELFQQQSQQYQKSILKSRAVLKVSVEAGSGLGWQYFVGNDGLIISQDSFGASAPEADMADHFGFTAEKIYQKIKRHYQRIIKTD